MIGPNYTTTATDHSGIALTVSSLLMTWNILCWFIRMYIRVDINGPLGFDDLAVSIGTFVGAMQATVSFISISNGFGKSLSLLSEGQITRTEKTQYVADILYIIACFFGNIAVALLIARLTRQRKHLKACNALVRLSGVWCIASVLAMALRCDLSRPWSIFHSRCTHLLLRWQIISAFSIAIELLLLAMSTWLVWDLQMKLMSKFLVVLAFAFRLPMIAAIGARIHYTAKVIESKDPFLVGVDAFICTQIAMNYGLMAATIPCLKPFVMRFDTGWGTKDKQTISSYGMDSLERSKLEKIDSSNAHPYEIREVEARQLRADRCSHATQISSTFARNNGSPAEDESTTSRNSNEMYIHRTVSYGVHCENEFGARLSDESFYVRDSSGRPIGRAE